MPENKPNFLESIQFQKKFPPFKWSTDDKKWTKIQFWWEKEVQNMIEFYLKDKERKDLKWNIISPKDNAERFKINCVLGNNWGGKSRLFRWLYAIKNIKDRILNNFEVLGILKFQKWEIKSNRNLEGTSSNNWVYEKKDIIIDDFFKLSGNIDLSINRKILNEKNYNDFLVNFYYYYQDPLTSNKYIHDFLKLEKNHWLKMKLVFNCEHFFSMIQHESAEKIISCDIERLLVLSKNKEDKLILLYMFVIAINHVSDWGDEFDEKIKQLEIKYNLYNEQPLNTRWFPSDLIWRDLDKIRWNFDESIYIDKKISIEFEMNHFLSKWDVIEIFDFIDEFWEIHLKFIWETNLEFQNLSAWQQTMLIRFTNIYKEILEQKEKEWKTDFLILIDEPDLHLHLDWQRQYIQKLIDVFSTLDSEINLHFIIATHSPFIISDLPKESLVLLNKWEQVPGEQIPETFGANYIDIIKNWFFFENKQMLMGSFAQNIIWDIAENERKYFTDDKELDKNHENIKNNIWDDFLKDNLLYFKPEKKWLK